MTDAEHSVCDCPAPATLRATSPARTRPTSRSRWLKDNTHAGGCGCRPCQVKGACIQKAMTFIAETAPDSVDLTDLSHTMPEN